MYSCGSMAPRNFKKFDAGGGCMNCTVHGVIQPWEQAEGALHTIFELPHAWCAAVKDRRAGRNAGRNAGAESVGGFGTLDELLAFLEPRFARIRKELWGLNHFPHHCQLKVSVTERLMDLVELLRREKSSCGENMISCISCSWGVGDLVPADFVDKLRAAAEQTDHRTLRLKASELLAMVGEC